MGTKSANSLPYLNGGELLTLIRTRLNGICPVIRVNGGKVGRYSYSYTIFDNDNRYNSGISDCLVLLPNSKVLWLELKGYRDVIRQEQETFRELTKKYCHKYFIVTNDNVLMTIGSITRIWTLYRKETSY